MNLNIDLMRAQQAILVNIFHVNVLYFCMFVISSFRHFMEKILKKVSCRTDVFVVAYKYDVKF